MRRFAIGVAVLAVGCGGKAATSTTPTETSPPDAAAATPSNHTESTAGAGSDADGSADPDGVAGGESGGDANDDIDVPPLKDLGPPILKWPVPAFTKAQRAEVNACKIADRLKEYEATPKGTTPPAA